MTEKLIVTVDNGIRQLTFGDSACDFELLSYSGFAAADYDVQMSAGGSSDGGYITSARLASRTLGIKSDFGGRDAETVRQALISFFAPNRKLTVVAKRGKTVRMITGNACDFDISESNIFVPSVLSFSILCPDPYFKATEAIQKNAAVVRPMFHMPCHLPTVFGIISSTGNAEITNNGDTYADLVASFTTKSASNNPYIQNLTNGKTIKINGNLSVGDKLTISTVRRSKGAFVNDARCIIDPASQFSDFLEVGQNQLKYGSDEGSAALSLSLQYTALYLGV